MTSVTLDTDVTDGTLEWMTACNIRNINQSLLRRMKAAAASEGLTLRDWAIRAFVRELGGIDGEANRTTQAEQLRAGDQRSRADMQLSTKARVRDAVPIQARSEGDSEGRKRGSRKMTDEEFMSLPLSEQLRARREGKF